MGASGADGKSNFFLCILKRPMTKDSLLDDGITVDSRLALFREALDRWPSSLEIVQRFVTIGDPFILSVSEHVELKHRIASQFGIHHSNILVVGSGKLGFSIAPKKRWRVFGETSDIDVAIVSHDLYELVWREISSLLIKDPLIYWPKKVKYAEFQLHGWMRPDLLPNSPALPLADDWFEFFRELTSEGCCGPYKISAGLYYDIHFLEQYQSRAVDLCMSERNEQSKRAEEREVPE
jgi:hypothetical protein